ncbi:hypothetical protein [Mucilaginibacter polytrichastri]|uniref:Uncharacterized protein n=1 Tax=Mucilaginibacter polytrichastri TaxID=1302689 RepID=A0A1Q5ZZI7_9SPHI|nr:hypothetical protein [Mucilaginibacter polytrichastri]OKS87184.1 hypothetical protein RG47T_2643 [Mucilaginibacter polytrichastri]SFT19291.1 hypothetical protein SAMN04487890_115114 [Mucilaginibacter polytrichastri]
MKNYKLILLAVVASCAFSACSGDHSPNNAPDSTTDNPAFRQLNVDTSKVTHAMGEATTVPNEASGGVTIVKDTTHMKVRTVTIAPSAAAAPAPAAKDTTAKK